jgi:hypothetical protein
MRRLRVVWIDRVEVLTVGCQGGSLAPREDLLRSEREEGSFEGLEMGDGAETSRSTIFAAGHGV